VEAAGFRALVPSGLVLGAEQHLRVDAPLEIGSINETVTVTGEAPLIKTEDAALGTRFNPTAFENLPVSDAQRRTMSVVDVHRALRRETASDINP
jgi:hypothetical protein